MPGPEDEVAWGNVFENGVVKFGDGLFDMGDRFLITEPEELGGGGAGWLVAALAEDVIHGAGAVKALRGG